MACNTPVIVVGGTTIATTDYQNAQELLKISGDDGDPTLDGYDENIAGGNNDRSTTGVQIGDPPVQTSPPTPSPVPGTESNNAPPPPVASLPTTCIPWDGNYDFQLSDNFKVRDFTINAVFPNELIDYLTYTKDVRCCNLQALARNVAEPLLAKFGKFKINSALRNKSSTPSGISQHITGQAVDVQFDGWSYDKYWDNAAWVKDNIPYDQFIFEHSDKTGLAWFHLSFSQDNPRPATDRTKVMTMYRNHYDPGLQKHG
jgi:hypothetical protein